MRNDPCWCESGKKEKACHKEIESHSAFAQLENFYTRLDDRINNEKGNLPCRRGCAQCCYDHFSVTSVEWYYILNWIRDKLGMSKVHEIIDKGYEIWDKLQ